MGTQAKTEPQLTLDEVDQMIIRCHKTASEPQTSPGDTIFLCGQAAYIAAAWDYANAESRDTRDAAGQLLAWFKAGAPKDQNDWIHSCLMSLQTASFAFMRAQLQQAYLQLATVIAGAK